MKTQVDERLRSEACTYALRFSCADCVYFNAEDGSCSEGYPSAPHRESSLEGRVTLLFCKSFELA